VLHPSAELYFAVRAAGGGLALPEVELRDEHTAEVEALNEAVRTRWRLTTTVLRDLEHHAGAGVAMRTRLLEAHAPLPPALSESWSAAEAAWDENARAAIAACRRPPAMDAPWCERGWWAGVKPWIESRIGAAEVVQTRVWYSSCVARVHAAAGGPATHFFKALPRPGERELRVTEWLSGRAGAPAIEAIDHRQRWLLLRAVDGPSLEAKRDPLRWCEAAATWGRLQASTLGREAELRALACVERPLSELAAAIAPLLADEQALVLPGGEGGLDAGELARVRALGPVMQARCGELAAAGIPYGLDHGDLWPSNVLLSAQGCVLIDWEDAGVAHPFLGLAPLLAMVRELRIDVAVDELADAYLAAFAARWSPGELRALFRRSLPLAMFEMAVRYWRMPEEAVALHPWMREMVPFFLRHALAC